MPDKQGQEQTPQNLRLLADIRKSLLIRSLDVKELRQSLKEVLDNTEYYDIKFAFKDEHTNEQGYGVQIEYMRMMAVRFKKIFAELDKSRWLNEKTRIYALGDGVFFNGHPLHLFRHTMAQYYLAATNWSLAYVAGLGGWENTEVLNKCYGGIPEHIKAQIAKSIHVRFDTLDLSAARSNQCASVTTYKN